MSVASDKENMASILQHQTPVPPPPAPTRRSLGSVVQGVASGLLLLVAISIRPAAAVGTIVAAALFVPLERLFRLRNQKVFRAGWRTDVVHFLVNNLFTLALLVAGFITIGLPLRALTPARWRAHVASLPHGRQFLLAVAIAEVAHYAGHRIAHTNPTLWRFHKLHHSIVEMDWLAAGRLHPVDQAVTKLVTVLPLFALGITRATFGAYLAFAGVQAIFIHANVKFRFGPLRWVVATPEFHHWHHGNTPNAYNTNFAGQLPIIDKIFGTLHLPTKQWPPRYGIDDTVPRGYLAQLAWPFKAHRSPDVTAR